MQRKVTFKKENKRKEVRYSQYLLMVGALTMEVEMQERELEFTFQQDKISI